MDAMSPRNIPWLAALFVTLCTLAAFLNSLDGEFLMDDHSEIVDNPLMEAFWPPWRVMFVGNGLPSRPLPYLTFAIDHAVWGKRPFGYHVTNLVIHVGAALCLFCLARYTLSSPRCRGTFSQSADFLAAAIASLWSVHPLNTQAVTYIYQRLESLTAMLCLLSLTAFAMAVARHWNVRWLAASIVASAAAMMSKETAVVLPLLIGSYDWLFCGETPAPHGRRIRFYACLSMTWLVLGIQLIAQASRYHGTGVFSVSPLTYFLTQPRVILHYLYLAFWPRTLCFDSNWELLTSWSDILPSVLCLTAFGVVVVYGLILRRPWSWPGLVFLLALAPSSSFVPLGAIAEEYRMYLALTAVAGGLVIGIYSAIRRWSPDEAWKRAGLGCAAGATFAILVVLITLTQARNRVYATPGGIWLDVLEQGRGGTRALWNLAVDCDSHHGFDGAMEYADEVMKWNPTLPVYEHIVGRRLREGDVGGAELYLRHAIAMQRDAFLAGEPVAVRNAAYLPIVLFMAGKRDEAEALAGEMLETVREKLGEDHRSTIELWALHASGLYSAGKLEAAERAARTAMALQASGQKQGGPSRGIAAACLTRILRGAAQASPDNAVRGGPPGTPD